MKNALFLHFPPAKLTLRDSPFRVLLDAYVVVGTPAWGLWTEADFRFADTRTLSQGVVLRGPRVLRCSDRRVQ